MKTLVLLDFYNYLYRAFYGIRPLHTKKGQLVNAVYGMATMTQSIMRDHGPFQICVIEEGGANWRREAYEGYKDNRKTMPDDLKSQVALIKEMFKHLNIPMISVSGQEADDVIASIATQSTFDRVLIASSDKDLFQLVGDKVKVLDTMKGIIFDEEKVQEKFGVKPSQIGDYLSLVGDSSDNVPGAKGIGPKAAQKLLGEFGTLEKVYENLDKIPEKMRQKLEESKESVDLSKKLVSLNLTLESAFKEEEYKGPNVEPLQTFFLSLDMNSLVNKFNGYSKSSS